MSDLFTVRTRPGSDGSMEFIDKSDGTTAFSIGATGNVLYKKVVVTSAQILALGGSPVAPVTIIAAPGVGKAIYVKSAVLYLAYNSATYANGSTVTFTENGITVFSTSATLINNASSIMIQPAFPGVGTTASLGVSNAPLVMNATAACITGDSPVDVHVWYSIVTA